MKLRFFKSPVLFLLAAVLFLSGCATELPKQTRRYVWPRPPDAPKIEWLKSYYSQHDFPKSDMQSTLEILFGEEAPIIFEKPVDIKSNGKGLVYVTDIVRNSIFVYDLNKKQVLVWKKRGGGEKPLAITPFYLSLDKDDNAYVVGAGEKSIFVLDSNGTVSRTIDFSDKIKGVAGIAVDNVRSRIYLVDNLGGKVEVYALSGEHLFSFGKPGDGEGEFNRPSPIIVNNNGEIVVGDTMNGRVQIFDGEGKFLRKIGQRGDSGHEFQLMKGVAVDSDDNVYVTDGKANQLKIFNTKGDYLISIGAAYSVSSTGKESPGGFLLPQGIHIDSSDTIYIADQANMRFQVFKYLKDEPKQQGGIAPKGEK